MNQTNGWLRCKTYIPFNNNPLSFYCLHGFPFSRVIDIWNISYLKTYYSSTSSKVLESPMDKALVPIRQQPVFPSHLVRLTGFIPSFLSISIFWLKLTLLSSMSTAVAFKSALHTTSVCFSHHCLWTNGMIIQIKMVSHPSSALILLGFPLH